MQVTRELITKGATLRVIGDRHDRPVGTIARVTDMGVIFIENRWWFTVEWLTYLPKRSRYSLRVWEEDLPTFELVTGPVDIPWPQTRTRKRDPFQFKPPSPQLSFPFVGNDTFLGMQVLPFDQRSETMSLAPWGQLPSADCCAALFIPMAIITKQSDADVLPLITDWHPALASTRRQHSVCRSIGSTHLSRQ